MYCCMDLPERRTCDANVEEPSSASRGSGPGSEPPTGPRSLRISCLSWMSGSLVQSSWRNRSLLTSITNFPPPAKRLLIILITLCISARSGQQGTFVLAKPWVSQSHDSPGFNRDSPLQGRAPASPLKQGSNNPFEVD